MSFARVCVELFPKEASLSPVLPRLASFFLGRCGGSLSSDAIASQTSGMEKLQIGVGKRMGQVPCRCFPPNSRAIRLQGPSTPLAKDH